jgi:hypothetical protein
MAEVPDWLHRGDYIRTRTTRKGNDAETDIEPDWADEAYCDEAAIELDPDPASQSKISKRTIGWSESAGFLISVITTRNPQTNRLWGVNAFRANDVDRNRYERGGTS